MKKLHIQGQAHETLEYVGSLSVRAYESGNDELVQVVSGACPGFLKGGVQYLLVP